MEFNPNDQARIIANRAKVRSVYDAALEAGNINLHGIKHGILARTKDIEHDLITAYFFGDDEKIQTILDVAEKLNQGLELIEQEIEKHPELKNHRPPCGDPNCNATDHSEMHAEVRVINKSDLLRILFGINDRD